MRYLLLVLFAGCCSVPQTIVQDRKYPVPEIRDSIIVRVDSVLIEGEKIVKLDTVFQFKYLPGESKVIYRVKPDSIVVRDTVQVYREQKDPEKHSFFYFVGFALSVAVITFVGVKLAPVISRFL